MGTDSFYYIMDYKGNYYRSNKSEQLVAVGEAEEATVFTFAEANHRIGTGKKAAFYCVVPIDSSTEEDAQEEEKQSEIKLSAVKELAYDELPEPMEKQGLSYDLSKMDWEEYLMHFAYIASGIKDYRDEMIKKESDIDQKICDVLHYIELCETNDGEAVDLIELLRVCREKRRDIKDEILRIDYFQGNLGTSANVAKAKQALKSIQGLAGRKYKPRKYEELFENCIIKSKHQEKTDFMEDEPEADNERMQYNLRNVERNENREDIMIEERIFTPFDGKKNDWLSFAKMQAEFYRNAGQYIRNLQIAIQEIDREIEAILQNTEDANYNVAQGYKVFKQLKKLRIERKEKGKELECLYALTDYIDCDGLADTCEDNLMEVEKIMGVAGENAELSEADEPGTKDASNENETITELADIEELQVVDDKVS